MIFFYIDESGTSFGDKRHPYFVLSAVAVDSKRWDSLNQFVHDLKSELVPWAKPEDWELKGRDLRHGGKESVFSNMNWPMRAPLFFQIAERMSTLELHLLAVRVYKP